MLCGLLAGCTAPQEDFANDHFSHQLFCQRQAEQKRPLRIGLYISYLDLAEMPLASETDAKQQAAAIAANALSVGCTDVFLQLRAFGDALYESSIYPSMQHTVLHGFCAESNFVQQLLDTLQPLGIRVHAWVNPYRLYPHGETDALYADFAEECVSWQNGLYLRPDSERAKQTVLAGIDEVLMLGFDGVHFDDYFYPTAQAEFDAKSYAAYTEAGGTLTLSQWRTAAVSDLIARSYALVKQHGGEKEFSISPDGSISRNESVHFADVAAWCTQEGFVDFICPQLYYGFQNETMPFADVLAEWAQLCTAVPLMPVLSAYKVGLADSWAGSGSEEWQTQSGILAAQLALVRQQSSCMGLSLYRYGSLFSPAQETAAAVMQEITLFTEEAL